MAVNTAALGGKSALGLECPGDGESVRRVHVAHLLYQFSTGGLENVVTQLINGLPRDRFRHSLIALTTVDERFLARITRPDVEVHALHKGPGQPFKLYPKVRRLLRQLRPDVLHSCNLAALDFMPAAAWAGVPRRVHAEHGWSVADPGGSNRRMRWLRRLYRPWVHDYVAVSEEIATYLRQHVGVSPQHVHFIENGIDLDRFRPPTPAELQDPPAQFPFDSRLHHVVGIVGRLEAVKNHRLLLDAFALASNAPTPAAAKLRLSIVGDGPLRSELEAQAAALGLGRRVWFAGTRDDVPALLRAMHTFVLCSVAEGTSCALQEAMGTGLRLIATDVGGNRRLLDGGRLGTLVRSTDVAGLADAMSATATGDLSSINRRHAEREFGIARTLDRYAALFQIDSDAGRVPATNSSGIQQ